MMPPTPRPPPALTCSEPAPWQVSQPPFSCALRGLRKMRPMMVRLNAAAWRGVAAHADLRADEGRLRRPPRPSARSSRLSPAAASWMAGVRGSISRANSIRLETTLSRAPACAMRRCRADQLRLFGLELLAHSRAAAERRWQCGRTRVRPDVPRADVRGVIRQAQRPDRSSHFRPAGAKRRLLSRAPPGCLRRGMMCFAAKRSRPAPAGTRGPAKRLSPIASLMSFLAPVPIDPVNPGTRAWLVMFDAPTIDRCDPMAPPEHYFRFNAATIDLPQKRSLVRE